MLRRIFSTTCLLGLTLMMLAVSHARAATWEHSFFSGTQYPLRVVYIEGSMPGPTIMVQAVFRVMRLPVSLRHSF